MNAEEIYEDILKILRKENLGWVADEIQQQILIGRSDSRKIQTVTESDSSNQTQLNLIDTHELGERVGRNVEYTAILQYTSKEKLLLLINALEQVTINLTDIKKSAWNLLSVHGNIRTIDFVDSQTGRHTHRLNEEEVQKSEEYEQSTRRAIQRLREEQKRVQ